MSCSPFAAAAAAALEDLEPTNINEQFLPVVLDAGGEQVAEGWPCDTRDGAMRIAQGCLKYTETGVAAGVRRRYVTDWGEVEG